jgi:DNA polymerase-1
MLMSIEDVFKRLEGVEGDESPTLPTLPVTPVNQSLEEVTPETQPTKPKSKRVTKPKSTAEPEVKPKEKVYHTYEDFDFHDLQVYAGIDCIVTSELAARTFPMIIEETPYKLVGPNGGPVAGKAPAIIESLTNIEMPAMEFLIDLQINGILYDCDKNRQIDKRMREELAELEDRIFGALGKKFNLDSGPEVSNLLYGELGLVAPFQTKTGDDATDGQALLTLAGLDPKAQKYIAPDPSKQFLADMAKRRDINSARNTFVKTYIEDFVKRDGRIHPEYNMVGTSGFRISGDSPNLLQLPRPKHGYNIRECYIVANGMTFIAFDFSSAEVKILAALCRDPGMLKAIADGLDFHSFSASAMIGVSYEEFVAVLKSEDDYSKEKKKEYKLLRQTAKILTFSLLYGSSVAGIAMQLNVTKEQAQTYMDMYFNAYPGMLKFIEESHKMSLWNKFVFTPFGQRKQEYGAQSVFKSTAAYNAALRNSSNVRVQSTTSTLGLVTFAEINKAMKKLDSRAKCICTVNHCGLSS